MDGIATPSSLVDFVLRHARIKTNVCSYQKWETGYTLLPRTVPDYNLIFATRGRIVWEIDGVPYTLRSQSLAIVPPAVPHRGHSIDKRITFISIHVEASLPGGQDAFELLTPPRIQTVRRHSRLDRYLRGAESEWSRGNDQETHLMLPIWSRLIILELIRDNALRGVLGHRPLNPVVAGVLDELNAHIDRPARLGELARISGFSPQHLNRMFHAQLGVTPLKYLMATRLDRAASMLAEGRLTVRAVARRFGFADVCYFTRLFTNRFGQSPARYRDR